ncbi:uncharacterized protein LOC132799336 isoform X2 [Ziziphus jujuba]|uniref:Uncharacterized protein LOC132799336 isoform X2 n=1 Tax=Ziziphus jujuba TaxID=326968 RepID=A0ABM4AF65_ZIZJJ|nr:uncharacterized protein LOC132799336 isoform X2 [Ziziphus jujuba]
MSSQFQDSFLYSRAYCVSEYIIAWNVDVGNDCCCLFASKAAALSFTDDGIQGQDMKVKLEDQICSASDHAMETKFRGGYLTFTMQFQRSDSGCNTWWIFIWPSSSARICDCSIFAGWDGCKFEGLCSNRL